jgi:ligand-binding sensor domain-containing protein
MYQSGLSKIWILLTLVFVGYGVLIACNRTPSTPVLVSLPDTPTKTSQATATPTQPPHKLQAMPVISTPLPSVKTKTNVQQAEVWLTHAPGNSFVNALAVEGDYVWAATAGDGIIRWHRTNGTFVKYNTTDGLVHNKVRAIAIDQAGHKWFGTEGGVSKFDGQTWTNYTTAHGLAHNKVLAIAIDHADQLWFGTWGGGLSKFDGQIWTTYTRANGLANNHIHALAVDTLGHLWVATPSGVSVFDGHVWFTYTTTDGLLDNWVHTIAVDQAGHKWFGTPKGVSEFARGLAWTWKSYTAADGLINNNIHAIAVDELGHQWVATAYGLSRFDGHTWTSYTTADGLPRSHITAIAVGPSGDKWFGTIDGVIRFDGLNWELYTTGSLVGNRVQAIAVDDVNQKWFGTERGVSKFDGATWTTYTSADGLVSDQVRAMAIDQVGHKWFGTDEGVSQFDGQAWTTYTTVDGLVNNQVKAIAIDQAGHKWFGTAGGVSQFDGATWTSYTTTHGLAGDVVTAIAIDEAGTKWFGTENGVSRFDGQTWQVFTTGHSLSDQQVTSIAIDQTEQVWVGFGGNGRGISLFDGQRWSDYTDQIVGYNFDFILSVAVDQAAHKWFGTLNGVVKFDNHDSTIYTYADGLASNRVIAMAVDQNGHVWLGTNGAGVSEFISDAEIALAPSPPPATPIVSTLTPLPQFSVSTPAPINPKVGPLPTLLVEVTLAPPGEELEDVLLNSETNRLYVTNTAHQLHILNATTYDKLATFPDVSSITLDQAHNRLYMANEEKITVIDATSLTEVAMIAPGGELVLDQGRGQVYIANRIYDAITSQQLGLLPSEVGNYNPARNEAVVTEEGPSGTEVVYGVDLEMLQITGDLLPDISGEQALNFHTGLRHISPDQNLIIVSSGLHVPGHGAGPDILLRLLDATTLDEFEDLGQGPPIEHDCNGQLIFAKPINGRIYRGEHYLWYSSFNNLLVYDLNGKLVTWRDGLSLGVTNPSTGQMYLWGRVFDLDTLSPIGTMPTTCIYTIDVEKGRIYARLDNKLMVFSERGGWFKPPPPDNVGSQLAGRVNYIHLSPNYPQDHTIFISAGDSYHLERLYRSTDGGQTWVHLRGGLPEQSGVDFNLAISPNFAVDHTLFVGGYNDTARGEGVYRSTDGGDTWQPMWQGLEHLRVQRVVLSPNYATDGTLLAYASYNGIIGYPHSGSSVFRSTDKGMSWTLVMTQASRSIDDLPTPEQLLPTASVPVDHFRSTSLDLEEKLTLYSPNFAADSTLYLITNSNLFRSTGGDTWERWLDERLGERDDDNRLTAAVISPLLADQSYRLFIGTAVGEFWVIDPTQADWEPIEMAGEG